MIVVRAGKDTMFDEVYFVLKKECDAEYENSESDIICEANRIINGEIREKQNRSRKVAHFMLHAFAPFAAGLILGAVAVVILRLLGV